MKYTIEEIKNYLADCTDIEYAESNLSDKSIKDANLIHVYTDDVTFHAANKTVKEFIKWVNAEGMGSGSIVAYAAIEIDGDMHADESYEIELYNLSERFTNNIPDTATHVVWYSR